MQKAVLLKLKLNFLKTFLEDKTNALLTWITFIIVILFCCLPFPPHKTDVSLDYLSPGPCLASLTLPVLRRQAHLGRHCDKLSQSNWGKTGKRFRPATCALRRGQRGQVRVRVSFGNTSFARHIHILFYFFQWQASRVVRRKEVTLPPAGHKQKGSSFRLVTVPHVPHGHMRSCEKGRGGFSVLNLD